MMLIGTSGWNYAHWYRRFYPLGLAPREQLTYLARHFDTVELNASFYRLPPQKNFAKWYADTPEDFRFSVKVPRTITHLKRLNDIEEVWDGLLSAVPPLGEKLSIYLAQFPPSFKATPETLERMAKFLELTSASGVRLGLELRHASWFEPDALEVFAKREACVVQAESSRFAHTPPGFAPARYTYYRFHGPRQLYSSQYTDEELGYWAGMMKADMAGGKDVYAYFDNDVNGYALDDAKRLRTMLGAEGGDTAKIG